MRPHPSKKLCCVGGVYRRTIGQFENAAGRIAPKKFLLGRDRALAERANHRLEALWEQVVAEHERQRQRSAAEAALLAGAQSVGPPILLPAGSTPRCGASLWPAAGELPQRPLWTEQTLQMAEMIRKGEHQPVVVAPAPGLAGVAGYADRLAALQIAYPGFVFVPADPHAFQISQQREQAMAAFFAGQLRDAQQLAGLSIAAPCTGSLHAALNAFEAWVCATRRKGGTLSAWGAALASLVRRLKVNAPDLPLSKFGFSAIEAIRNHWAGRPLTRHGKPCSVDHVKAQVKALRLFCRWLHRSSDFEWRLPEDFAEAVKLDVRALMTPEEHSVRARGVSTCAMEELAMLFSIATPRERLLLLLGLNCGFARAEIVSLRLDEIVGERIQRIRTKSGVYAEWALWPETRQALGAAISARPTGVESPYLLVSQAGAKLPEQRVANWWNRLLSRARRRWPAFRGKSFKYLRKTAAQWVRDAADGETAGVFLAHGRPVPSDDLSSLYSRPDFGKVDRALAKVRGTFLAALAQPPPDVPSAPSDPRAWVRLLAEQGKKVPEIIKLSGLSRASVYRLLARRSAASGVS